MSGTEYPGWEEIRRRMDHLERDLTAADAMDERDRRALLRRRAEALAKVADPDAGPGGEERLDLVSFTLGEERYALEACHVERVFMAGKVTPLPCVPEFVAGVVSVRGRIVSLVDLRRLLDLPGREAIREGRALLIAGATMRFGLLTGGVEGKVTVPTATLQRDGSLVDGGGDDFTKGILPDGLVVLDGEKLLQDRRLVIDEEVLP